MTERGVKYDDGKLRYDLIPENALEEIVRVLTYGAQKYGERNWEKGLRFSRLFAAAQRHLWAWWKGEEEDRESGCLHLAHAATCIMMLLALWEWDPSLDDRPNIVAEAARDARRAR